MDGFRLKFPKLVIAQTSIPLLGFIISVGPTGVVVKPDPTHSDAILKLQEPSDIHGVRQFLGTCNWYSKFIPQYADLTEPLLHLTRKDVPVDIPVDKGLSVSLHFTQAANRLSTGTGSYESQPSFHSHY